ncbi:MAG: sulfatase-like hydrolase/transferase [Halobacteriota archaeon]
MRSVFDLQRHEVTMAAKGGMNHTIADIFGNPPRASVEELEPPFVHVVRRPGGHAPYDGFEWDTYEYLDESAVEYLYDIADDPNRGRREYVAGVKRSFEEFRRVLDVLEERELRDDTLVIYTSDHGELLGEYGFFGHTHLATPEICYVPTMFVHPALEPEPRDELLHHTDLLPSIGDALGVDVGETDGVAWGEGRTTGYTHFEHVRYGKLPEWIEPILARAGGFERTIRALWDDEGGHTFVDSPALANGSVFLYLLLKMPPGRQMIHQRQVNEAYQRFKKGHQEYGTPSFDEAEARSEIATILEGGTEQRIRDLDEETRDQLQDMGYI